MDVGAVGHPDETITWQECEDCEIGWGPFTRWVDLRLDEDEQHRRPLEEILADRGGEPVTDGGVDVGRWYRQDADAALTPPASPTRTTSARTAPRAIPGPGRANSPVLLASSMEVRTVGELTGERVKCLDCGHVGVDVEGPQEGETDTYDFTCPECGHEASMEGPLALPMKGGPISDLGGEDGD